MSVYGDIVCEQCKIYMFLGKTVSSPDGKLIHFAIGEDGSAAAYAVYTRALWKFMADHAGHPLRVLLEHELAALLDKDESWTDVGSEVLGISYEDYLANWPGWPEPETPPPSPRRKFWRRQ